MKKLYAILVSVFSVSMANATIIPITVNASAFSPAAVNAVCGDTVGWVWGGSGSHTTTSTTIPGCATAWNAPISATSFTFAITIPSCPGVYNYVCTPHGFTGTITVTCANSVSSLSTHYVSTAYPMPCTSKLTIEAPGAEVIAIYNTLGEKIKTIAVPGGQSKTTISLADLNAGIYFYSILKEGVIVETRKIVKN